MKRYCYIFVITVVIAVSLAVPAFSQEAKESATKAPEMATEQAPAVAPVQAAAPAEAPAAPEAAQVKDTSIYGEVLAVNTAANTMTVQYYDYDSDEEKTVELGVSADTRMENVAGFNDVKKGDWVDAAYSVMNGKNAAKSVMVEKEEAAAVDTAAPAADTVPAQQ